MQLQDSTITKSQRAFIEDILHDEEGKETIDLLRKEQEEEKMREILSKTLDWDTLPCLGAYKSESDDDQDEDNVTKKMEF